MPTLNDFGEKFAIKIRAMLTDDMTEDRNVYIAETGLVIIKNSNGSMLPKGCPLCLTGKLSQNSLGDPMLDGNQLIRGEDFDAVSKDTPVEILANLWICPRRKLPQSNLFPAFAGRPRS
jgi:hypothetical protein